MSVDNAADNSQYDILLRSSDPDREIHEWVMGSFSSIDKQILPLCNVETKVKDDQHFKLIYEIIGNDHKSASGELQIIYHPIPTEFMISNPYPNPFNPVTVIEYGLPAESNLSIKIFDIRGRMLMRKIKNGLEPGYYTFSWDAAAYSSGIYFIQFRVSDIIQTYRVLLLK